MMKPAVLALLLFLVLNSSQANTTATAQPWLSQKPSGLKNPTQTKNALVRAIPRSQRRLLINSDVSDDDPPGPAELDMHGPYSRPELVKDSSDTDRITDYATVRLAVARARAMQIYRENWA